MKRQTRNPKKLRRQERHNIIVTQNFRNLCHDDLDGNMSFILNDWKEQCSDTLEHEIRGMKIRLNKKMPKNKIMLVPTELPQNRIDEMLREQKIVFPIEVSPAMLEELKKIGDKISFRLRHSNRLLKG